MRLGFITNRTAADLELAQSIGYSSVELFFSVDEAGAIDFPERDEFVRALADSQVTVSAVALHNDDLPICGDPMMQALSQDRFKIALDIACLVDANVLCAGSGSDLTGTGLHPEEDQEQTARRIVETFGPRLEQAHDAGRQLSFMTCKTANLVRSPSMWRRVLPQLKGMGIKFDPSHANDAAHLAEQGDLDLVHLAGGVPDWYRKLGYEQAGSRYRYHLDRGNFELLPKLDCEAVTGVEEHLEEVHELHIAQRSGNMRSLHNTEQSFSRYPGELLAARLDGKLKAHLYADSDNSVLECAGEPAELIAGLARELFHRRDREHEGVSTTARDKANRALRDVEVTLEVSPLRTDLIALLDTLGIPCERSFWHMVRVTDPPALAAKLGFEGSIVPTGREEGFTVTTDLGEETMTRGAVGRLLFGPERFPLRAQSPIPLFAPSTDHV